MVYFVCVRFGIPTFLENTSECPGAMMNKMVRRLKWQERLVL
jgi:hypothetical protein